MPLGSRGQEAEVGGVATLPQRQVRCSLLDRRQGCWVSSSSFLPGNQLRPHLVTSSLAIPEDVTKDCPWQPSTLTRRQSEKPSFHRSKHIEKGSLQEEQEAEFLFESRVQRPHAHQLFMSRTQNGKHQARRRLLLKAWSTHQQQGAHRVRMQISESPGESHAALGLGEPCG